jgi:hypothetical protein
MLSHGFKQSDYDSFVSLKIVSIKHSFASPAKEKSELAKLKAHMSNVINDLVVAKKILGIAIVRDRKSSKLYLD